MSENIFEQASRLKIRFPYKFAISVEDLWDLSLRELDKLFKGLNGKLKTEKEESLLDKGSKNTERNFLELQIAIIKRVAEVKIAEEKERVLAIERTKKREKVLEILAKKQDTSLEGMSEEELRKMLEEL
jgi:hypothetical protein